MPKRRGGWYGESARHSEARKKGTANSRSRKIYTATKNRLTPPDPNQPIPRDVYSGKTDPEPVTVYHRTTRANANKIVAGQEFTPNTQRDSRIYGSTEKKGAAGSYGPSVVSVQVPRGKVKVDTSHDAAGSSRPNERWLSVAMKTLKGRKITRQK